MNNSESKNFFSNKGILPEDVMYILREERKSVIYLKNNLVVKSFNPIKNLLVELPQEKFISVNKGVVLGKRYIKTIDNGIYSMIDGKCFKGRQRPSKEQQQNVTLIKEILAEGESAKNLTTEEFIESFSVLNTLPLPFFILEVIVNENTGMPVDFIFRYCNKATEAYSKVRCEEELINNSFYSVFPNVKKTDLITCADVAFNGSFRVLKQYVPHLEKKITVYCFQPKRKYCGCLIIQD